MNDLKQYLRVVIGGVTFLLSNEQRHSIEERGSLVANTNPASKAAVWWPAKSGRWPAFALGADLRPAPPPATWQKALFLETPRATVGMIVGDIQLLLRGQAMVNPFTALGPAPTRHGPLFTSAWVHDGRVSLVLEPKALIGYLEELAA